MAISFMPLFKVANGLGSSDSVALHVVVEGDLVLDTSLCVTWFDFDIAATAT